MYTEWISKEEELARFKKAAIAFTKKVTASKEAALEFLISVGYLPADYKLPKMRRSRTVKPKAKPRVATSKRKKIKSKIVK